MRDWHDPGGDGRGRSARRAARRISERIGVAGGAREQGLGYRHQAKFGQGRAADRDQAGLGHCLDKGRGLRRDDIGEGARAFR